MTELLLELLWLFLSIKYLMDEVLSGNFCFDSWKEPNISPKYDRVNLSVQISWQKTSRNTQRQILKYIVDGKNYY